MAVPLEPLVFWAAVTFVTPVAIAILPLSRRRISDPVLHVMLGLSAGLLLGTSFMNILPESFGVLPPGDETSVPFGLFAGFFVLFVAEHLVLRRRTGGHVHFENGREIKPFGTLALGALALHGLLDGFVIPLGFSLGAATGTVITLAVALHQIPDSFAAVSVALGAGYGRRRSAAFVLATALDTPVGIGLGLAFLGTGIQLLPFALAFAAGTFLFVSAADLIPELQHRTRSALVGVSIFVGFAIVATLTLVLPGV